MKCNKCYIEGDHWTSKCPLKLQNTVANSTAILTGTTELAEAQEVQDIEHVPKTISNRDNSIKISNLPKYASNVYLQELAKPFGKIKKIHLAKYKDTKLCRGFAFIEFKSRSQAAKAIEALNKHKYGNLILNVDWSDPPAQKN